MCTWTVRGLLASVALSQTWRHVPAARQGRIQPFPSYTVGPLRYMHAAVFSREVTGTDGYIEVLMYHIDNREYVGRWVNDPTDGVRDASHQHSPQPFMRACLAHTPY